MTEHQDDRPTRHDEQPGYGVTAKFPVPADDAADVVDDQELVADEHQEQEQTEPEDQEK